VQHCRRRVLIALGIFDSIDGDSNVSSELCRPHARASAAGGGGMQGIWHPNYLYGGYWYVYPLEKPNTYSHANCMQHVLRCWERQSDDSEYKQNPSAAGALPGPRWGSLQRSHKPPSWWRGAGCPLPKNPTPSSRLFGPRLSYPHSGTV